MLRRLGSSPDGRLANSFLGAEVLTLPREEARRAKNLGAGRMAVGVRCQLSDG